MSIRKLEINKQQLDFIASQVNIGEVGMSTLDYLVAEYNKASCEKVDIVSDRGVISVEPTVFEGLSYVI